MPVTPADQPILQSRSLLWATLVVLGGVIAQAMSSQSLLSAEVTATALMSPGTWRALVVVLGGRVAQGNSGEWIADVDFLPLLLMWSMFAAVSGVVAALLIRRKTPGSWSNVLTSVGFAFGWWWVMGAWELLRLLAFSLRLESIEQFLLVSPQLWQAFALAGWLAQMLAARSSPSGVESVSADCGSSWKWLLGLIAVYVVVFTAMNWRLWFNLRIPHGDSAMYEEHLWNLTHGKGFRSYLDQGLFLGEHIQVIHLLLLPLHWIWPSHLLLELCESTALAIGAIPVFRMAQRSTGSSRAGLLLAAAYLLYFPLHYLDIEVDLKTFRPESFCVPFFLFAFDALEQRRLRRMCVLLLIALSAKEDYSIIIAPLGVWIALQGYFGKRLLSESNTSCESNKTQTARAVKAQASVSTSPPPSLPRWISGFCTTVFELSSEEVRSAKAQIHRDKLGGETKDWSRILLGLGIAVFGVVYLIFATRVVIPWFRGGAELHYVKYFSKFGNSMNEVVWNMLTKPSLLFGELVTAGTLMYALSMLLPIGFIALLSPSRLAVGLPLFGILCLNELAHDPRHHFHAPLVPVIFWATAIGIGNVNRICERITATFSRASLLTASTPHLVTFMQHFVWTSAFATGLFLSMSPAGLSFWDANASTSLWKLYAHDPRADHLPELLAQIPPTARVASNDFVHPRFTHHERSYDYSHYRRRIAGYGENVPDDTDFIVFDTRHPYSDLKSPDQVRELKDHPDDWELLPDKAQGYFIVLRRRASQSFAK
ncbi:MAG: DUF2079 domain-containing protein [Planctomycetia bacterium]|nr:DUF2079 domain-containing protein [Planctomycetia bacterium]